MYYREITNEKSLFKKSFEKFIPVMIKGPTGCGKSRFVQNMSEDLNIPLTQVACNEETSSVDLQGRFLIKNNMTVWQDGPLTNAVKKGHILYLDEISEAREDIIVIIHPLTDYRRELYLDKQNILIKAHKNFMLVASYNPGYQNISKEMKLSTKQRFITLNFNYPEPNIEKEIVIKESYLDNKKVNFLIQYVSKLRNLKEINIVEDISTRLIINTAKLIKSGIDIKTAVNAGIINVLTDDKEMIINLNDILDIMI